MTRLLAVDLDGTLIARDGRGAREAAEPFRRLASQGISLAIATGRMMQSAQQIYAEMGVERGHIIALNGAELWAYPIGERPLWQREIAPPAARRALEICLQAGAELQGYVSGRLLVLRRTKRTEAYARRTRVRSELVDPDEIAASPQKLLALLPPERTGPLIGELKAHLGGQIECFRSEPDFVEVVPVGVHKGVALRALGEILGIGMDETAAAGDAENDVEMLRMAGRAFAPTTAAAAVRSLSPELLPPPPELSAALFEALRR